MFKVVTSIVPHGGKIARKWSLRNVDHNKLACMATDFIDVDKYEPFDAFRQAWAVLNYPICGEMNEYAKQFDMEMRQSLWGYQD